MTSVTGAKRPRSRPAMASSPLRAAMAAASDSPQPTTRRLAMDFLKLLKSLEDFVYEALTWIILLPRTLLRILFQPLRMTGYADSRLLSDSEARFKEAISPPLLLILCVLISHFIDLGVRANPGIEGGYLEHALLGSEQNLLVYRTIAFGVWALAGAAYYLLRAGRTIDRDTLRAPFYEQCYLVAPFAFIVSVGVTSVSVGQAWAVLAGVVSSLAGTLWFVGAQTAWVRRKTSQPWWRSAAAALVIVLTGSVVNAGVGYILRYAPPSQGTAQDANGDPPKASMPEAQSRAACDRSCFGERVVTTGGSSSNARDPG